MTSTDPAPQPADAAQPDYPPPSPSPTLPPPPAQVVVVTGPRRRTWSDRRAIIIGVLCGLGVLCCFGATIGGVVIGRNIYWAAQDAPAARAAATDYFTAIKAHEWDTAKAALSTSLRATVTVEALQATWTRREQANGTITGFTITQYNVFKTNQGETATIVGTLEYTGGATEEKLLRLVREDGHWRLTTLP